MHHPNEGSGAPSPPLVGFPTALGTAVGLIMASPVILTVSTGFGLGGAAFAVAMAIAFILMQAQAMSFAEAASILPTSGSVYDYVACGLGRFWAVTSTICAYILVHVFAGTAVTILGGTMALVNFEGLDAYFASTGTGWLVGVGMVMLFGAVNAFGIRVFSRLEIVLTIGVWVTLMAFGVLGVLMAPASGVESYFGESSVGTSLPTILSMVGMAMFMFVGFEFVTPLAAEMRQPERHIPRAMHLGLCLVALCMLLYGSAMVRQVANVPVEPGASVRLLETPLAIPKLAEQVLGPAGRIWLGIGFLCAAAATINTLMAGLPRIMYGMALDGALPRIFTYTHPRLKTPLVGIAAAIAIPGIHAWILGGRLDGLANLVLAAVCAWGFAYILVTISVIVLRMRRPDLPRPYRSPWFPLPQLISIGGILVAIWYITPPGTSASDVYVPFGIMLGATCLYSFIWLRFVRRVPLFQPIAVEQVLAREPDPTTAPQPEQPVLQQTTLAKGA